MGLLDSVLNSLSSGSQEQSPKVKLAIALLGLLMARQGQAETQNGGLLGTLGSLINQTTQQDNDPNGGLGGLLGGLLNSGSHPAHTELGGLFNQLQQAGLGDALKSWLGTDRNQPLSATDINKIFDSNQLHDLASSAGMSEHEAAQHLSTVLPELVDELSSDEVMKDPEVNISSILSRFS